jgi:hypothetical protein
MAALKLRLSNMSKNSAAVEKCDNMENKDYLLIAGHPTRLGNLLGFGG